MGLFDAVGRAVGSAAAGAVSGWQANFAKAVDRVPSAGPANAAMPTDDPVTPSKSLAFDPWAIMEQLGYKEKASPLSYGMLNTILQKMPVAGAVVHNRVNQVAAFSRVQPDRYGYGYRIRQRDRRAKETAVTRRTSQTFETFMQRTGVADNPRGRDNFETFLRKFVRDSLRYDQAVFEVVPNRRGKPAAFEAFDAASFRLADTERLGVDQNFDDEVRYVQIYDGVVINEYTQTELCFAVRNPCTDLRLHGYGTSELEMALNSITGLLNGWDYNSRFFSQGSGAKGVLNFKGTIPDKMLQNFKTHFYSMLTGVQNAWRTPVINAEDVQWIPLQGMSNADMEFGQWIDFLIKVFCSFYLMNPVEINFQYGNVGQSQALNQESNTEKVVESRERGLRPLLDFVANAINVHLVWPTNEDFEFEFVGLDTGTPDQMADLLSKQVKTTTTIDEARAEEGKPPLPDGMGSIILDPTYLQHFTMQQQAAQGGSDDGAGQPPNDQQASGAPPQPGGIADGAVNEDALRQMLGQGGGKSLWKSQANNVSFELVL